ncbi:MAG: GrpB family protein [Gaiellaceae bacterium MAG52_C11]|nr:GrpB family protein [Candidatus Gaiellasilicea maunaloa]
MSSFPRLLPSDPRAPQRFDEEAAGLGSAIRGTVAIEHVGSTAVPGLAGKGTIDIALGVRSLELEPSDLRAMQERGYTYGGTHDLPQHVFRRGERVPWEFLVHVVIHDGPMWRDYLTFRDHLRENPEDAATYAVLKASLLNGREDWYSGSDKASFIVPILTSHSALVVPRHLPERLEPEGPLEEIPLVGGDVNEVVRVGDTVRRPPQPSGVRELLCWYETVGFDGAPRFLGFDDKGREVLSYVEGEPAFAPVPSSDRVVEGIGKLLRRAHDAQAGFQPRANAQWDTHVAGSERGEIIGHLDLFWTNVIFRDGHPCALIDWELAAPTTRVLEVALAATYWVGLRADEQLIPWGVPLERRGERLRLLCDVYGLSTEQRRVLLDELIAQREGRLARADWRVTGRDEVIANLRWLMENQQELAGFLA